MAWQFTRHVGALKEVEALKTFRQTLPHPSEKQLSPVFNLCDFIYYNKVSQSKFFGLILGFKFRHLTYLCFVFRIWARWSHIRYRCL